MVDENLIHLKFEYEEAKQSKMQLLSLQKDILNIAQIINNYNVLRMKELDVKTKLHLKSKSVLNDLKKIHRLLPKEGVPEILKEKIQDLNKTKEKTKDKIKQKDYNPDIASQLKDIQNKLNSLSK